MFWFVVREGSKYGPYTANDLKQMATSGHLTRADQICKGNGNPVCADRVKGLVFPENQISQNKSDKPLMVLGGIFGCIVVFGTSLFLIMCIGKLFSRGGGAGKIFSTAASSNSGPIGSKTEALTADYYPYKEGFRIFRDGKFNSLTDIREYKYVGNGEISIKWVFACEDNRINVLPRFLNRKDRLLHRQKNGYVDIGETDLKTGQLLWVPWVKIGAVVGDTWSRKMDNGNKEHFKLVEFKDDRISYKKYNEWENVRIAVIERVFVHKGEPVEGLVHLAKGVGPVEEYWYMDLPNGGKRAVAIMKARDFLY